MKPGFALSLSAEGIVLLHRAAGGWRNVGTVALDSADLAGDLAALKAKGDALDPSGLCKLIIPNDQIRYLTIETGISDLESRHRLARAALEGATPYAVSDLAFDLSEDGSQTHIAAVAYETLAEAESFALENGFTPASFVATPGETGFLGEPFFGMTSSLGDAAITPDGIAVVDIGPAPVPMIDPHPPAAATATPIAPAETPSAQSDKAQPAQSLPKAPADLEPGSDHPAQDDVTAEDSGPITGFSSRRRKAPTAAPTSQKVSAPGPATAGSATATPSRVRAAPPAASSDPAPGAAKPVPSPAAKSKTAAPAAKPVGSATPAEAGSAKPTSAGALGASGAKSPANLNPSVGSSSGSTTKVPPAPVPPPVSAPASPPASTRPKGPALSGAAAQAADSLNASLQDRSASAKGKPRFLGLILTAVLLLIMAAIAAFALFSEGGVFFSSERPPLQETIDDPLADPSDPAPEATEDAPVNLDQPRVTPSDSTSPAEVPIAEIETEPDSIAPQVSALSGQPDPGAVELGDLAQPTETDRPDTDSQLDASTGQPVLDALEGSAPEQDPAEALSEAALYAATGIWQQVPQIAEAPALVSLDDIYIASIDNSDLSQDAVALPGSPQLNSDPAPDALSSPAAAGSNFELDDRGLVTATPEGTLNPDGVMVYLGRPSITPPPTPARATPEDAADEAENARLASLSRKRPRPRPSDLLEQAERALLGGLSRAELARVRPRARPASLKTEEQESQPVSSLAIATSTTPRARPANFANLVDRATRQRATAPTGAAAVASVPTPSVTPSIPSSASVARQATVKNAINLRRINLIGVSGKPSNRQALVLMPSGRTRQVRIGDRLDGGTVVAISDTQLQYQKRGTNTTLKLPGN